MAPWCALTPQVRFNSRRGREAQIPDGVCERERCSPLNPEHPCTKRTPGSGALVETTLLRNSWLVESLSVAFQRLKPARVSPSELESPRLRLRWGRSHQPSAAARRILISPRTETSFHLMI